MQVLAISQVIGWCSWLWSNKLVQLALDRAPAPACRLTLAGTPARSSLAWLLGSSTRNIAIRPHCLGHLGGKIVPVPCIFFRKQLIRILIIFYRKWTKYNSES